MANHINMIYVKFYKLYITDDIIWVCYSINNNNNNKFVIMGVNIIVYKTIDYKIIYLMDNYNLYSDMKRHILFNTIT